MSKEGGGGSTQNSQQAENWFLYSSNVARKVLVSLWGAYYNLLGHGHKLSNLIVDRFYEPNALCDV